MEKQRGGNPAAPQWLVRVHHVNREIAGAGCLVDDSHIMTCAHVVYDAGAGPGEIISVDFVFATGVTVCQAEVLAEYWCPPDQHGNGGLATLRLLTERPPGTLPAPLVRTHKVFGHECRLYGFPRGQMGGAWARGTLLNFFPPTDTSPDSHNNSTDPGWIQLEANAVQGRRIDKGFAGAPIWDETLHMVIGIMMLPALPAKGNTAALPYDACCISTDALTRAFPPLRETIVEALPPSRQPLSNMPFHLLASPYTDRPETHASVAKGLRNQAVTVITRPRTAPAIGGMGKTQLALSYAKRSLETERYRFGWWIRAGNPITLSSDYLALGHILKSVPASTETSPQARRHAIRNALEKQEDWLLIFDEVPAPADIALLLPSSRRSHILITSGNRNGWHKIGATSVQIDAFAEKPAQLFLLSHTKGNDTAGTNLPGTGVDTAAPADEAQANALATVLERFALGLAQAGTIIRVTGRSLAACRQLAQPMPDLRRQAPLDQEEAFPASRQLILAVLQEDSTECARALACLYAWLASEDIPDFLFAGTPQTQENLAELVKLGILTRNPADNASSMHPFVQETIRTGHKAEAEHTLNSVMQRLRQIYPDRTRQEAGRGKGSNRTAIRVRILPHMIAVCNHAFTHGLTPQATHDTTLHPVPPSASTFTPISRSDLTVETLADLLDWAAIHMEQEDSYRAEAQIMRNEALIFRMKSLGPRHPATIMAMERLASLLHRHKERETITELRERFPITREELWETPSGRLERRKI